MDRRNMRKIHYELSKTVLQTLQNQRVLSGTVKPIIKACGISDSPQRVAKFLEWAEGTPAVPFIVKRKLIRTIQYPMVHYTIQLKDNWTDQVRFGM